MRVHASGPADPAQVWERYVVPSRWSGWAPLIQSVDFAGERVTAGAEGVVHGPLGLRVHFVVESVDEVARLWSWRVRAGPVALRLDHGVTAAAGGGSVAWAELHGPAVIVGVYAPVARDALRRLVRSAS